MVRTTANPTRSFILSYIRTMLKSTSANATIHRSGVGVNPSAFLNFVPNLEHAHPTLGVPAREACNV